MEHFTPTSHDDASCPYCRGRLRHVPGIFLGHGGFECPRCGDFIDFSRNLTAADGPGTVDEHSGTLTAPR